MKIHPIFSGKVENYRMELDDPTAFSNYKRSFEGKKIQIILRKYRTQQSIKQLRFYFGVVVPIVCEWTGEPDKEAVHYALKRKFLVERDEKGLKIVPSIRKTTTTEAEIYVEKIRAWLAEEGIVVPEPDKIEQE